MRNKPVFPILAVSSLFALCAQDVRPTMNARDMFYSAGDMMGPKKSQVSATPRKSTPKPPVPGKAVQTVTEIPAAQNAEVHFQTISNQSQLPLGLRYSILRKTDDGMIEVKTDSVFHSGDHIRVSVMGNQKGYLYVISRGVSGIWTPLFPHPDSSQKQNQIVPGRNYEIPGGDGEFFVFDQQAGAEKLFLLFSRTTVQNLEEVVLGLGGDGNAAAAPSSEPRKKLPVLMASNQVNDQFINQLRSGVQSRDLVFTRTDAQPVKSGEPKEEAVYVVNQSSTGHSASRVVVDLTLKHQ